jgi:hypothetical protein
MGDARVGLRQAELKVPSQFSPLVSLSPCFFTHSLRAADISSFPVRQKIPFEQAG